MTLPAATRARQRLAYIVEGGAVPGPTAVPSGRFRPTDGRVPLEQQPEGLFYGRRGYEMASTPNSGGTVALATLIEGSFVLTLRIAHARGAGETLERMQTRIDEDVLVLRAALEDFLNWDNQESGIAIVKLTDARTQRLGSVGDVRHILELVFRVQVEDVYPVHGAVA